MSHLKASSGWGPMILAVLVSWSLTVHFARASAISSNEVNDGTPALEHNVTFQRSPDAACTQCHQEEKNKLSGVHGRVLNTKTIRDITCIDCHTSITPAHRDGAKDVVKFNHAQSVKGGTSAAAYIDSIVQQNESCTSCHAPLSIRKANWTHDVHAQDLSCASCHVVHLEKDPMKGISEKANIQTCVDCHSDQYNAREKDK